MKDGATLFPTFGIVFLTFGIGAQAMAIYLLLTLLIALVIYLFYAVIHPERF